MGLSLRKKLYAMEKKEAPTKPMAKVEVSSSCRIIEKNYTPSINLCTLSPYLLSFFINPQGQSIDIEKVLFIDTETTGLSRGVGTVAFLTGIGYVRQGTFTVKQYLMEDYVQEKSMLEAFAADFAGFEAYATFNGKSYDIPLLQSRFVMNKLPLPNFSLPHLDLLHPARRNWKLRLNQCNLQNLEGNILNIHREGDIPGALIPQRYFDYLKSGNFYLLKDIVEHNQQDILSLFLLLEHLCGIFMQPQQQSFAEDLFSTARQLEKIGDLEKAHQCYQLSAKGKFRAPAYMNMGTSLQRQKKVDEAIEIYCHMVTEKQGGLQPYIQLSKLYEHQKRDIPSALLYTEKGLACAADLLAFSAKTVQDGKNDLQYRYMRLLRKREKLSRRINH